MNTEKLPSLWQLGDYVSATFPGTGLLKKCRVIKIAFTQHSEPLYDIEVPFQYYQGSYDPDSPDMPTTGSVRIHGLKEWHLRNPEERVADRNPLPAQESIGAAVRPHLDVMLKRHKESYLLGEMENMCIQSLPPELYEKWVEISGTLRTTRKALKN